MSPSSVREMASPRAHTQNTAELADHLCTPLSFGNARMLAQINTHTHSLSTARTPTRTLKIALQPEDTHTRTHAHKITHLSKETVGSRPSSGASTQRFYLICIALADILLRSLLGGVLSGFIKVVHHPVGVVVE
jgi:hypothetical protein